MKHRKLGRTNFDVSEIGYGAWGIGGSMWIGASDKESLAAATPRDRTRRELYRYRARVWRRTQRGTDRQSGRRGGPRKVYVATKVPPKNRIWPAPPGVADRRGVSARIHRSLHRREPRKIFGIEAIDLQQLHVWSPEWLDSDEWRSAFEDLKTQGKVQAVGISINNHQPDTALGIIETGLIDTVQVIYNIFDQSPERNLFPACIKHNIGVLARVPLDEGALTGRITERTIFPEGDFRNSYFRGDRKKQVAERVAALRSRPRPGRCEPFAGNRDPILLIASRGVDGDPRHEIDSSVEGNVMASGQGPLPAPVLEILRRHAWDRDFYK